MNNKPEIAYLIQNILPLLTEQFDFPRQENESAVKIDEIPIQMGSGPKKPDVVYYHQGLPVALLEAKRPEKNLEKTLEQAMSYARLFPVDKYSNGLVKPKIIIVSIGRELHWYRRWVELEGEEAKDHIDKIEPLSYEEVLAEYGLADLGKKRILSPIEFRSELIGDLVAIYKTDRTVTPEVVGRVAEQILAWLQWGENNTSHEPYISLEGEHERQAQLRGLYRNIDIPGSLGPEAARSFRQFVLRAFQGQYNQFLTDQRIISFMCGLVGEMTPDTTVLDFECGSGGFIAAAVDTYGVKLENVRGVDVNKLPYSIAKTYLAVFFSVYRYEEIQALPIKHDNGLFPQGGSWDLVIGNPSGGSKYDDNEPKRNDLRKVLDNLQADLDGNGRDDSFSEYNFSIQQALQSAKVGGKICLILPEGLFANSRDEFLRNYITKYCKVLAIISLPRGVFRRGTSTQGQNSGSSVSNQKMSILLVEKTYEILHGATLGDQPDLQYPIFMAQVSDQGSDTDERLEEVLNVVAKQWISWRNNDKLLEIPDIKFVKNATEPKSKAQQKLEIEDIKEIEPKPVALQPKVQTSVNSGLSGLFNKNFKVNKK